MLLKDWTHKADVLGIKVVLSVKLIRENNRFYVDTLFKDPIQESSGRYDITGRGDYKVGHDVLLPPPYTTSFFEIRSSGLSCVDKIFQLSFSGIIWVNNLTGRREMLNGREEWAGVWYPTDPPIPCGGP